MSAITDDDLADELNNLITDLYEEIEIEGEWNLKPDDFTAEAMQAHADWLHWWTDFAMEWGEDRAVDEYSEHMGSLVALCAVYTFFNVHPEILAGRATKEDWTE